MSLTIHPVTSYSVTIGQLTLHLSGLQITGNLEEKTTGTVTGETVRTAQYKRLHHITLRGALSPETGGPQTAAALIGALGNPHLLNVAGLRFRSAVLCSFSVQMGQLSPEAVLVFSFLEYPEVSS
ncbi:MAG: hypothetical protein IJ055_00665 [Oscillospiraceae bacterium]|nr:hypothetical protein [Oscillospiraceae bacterium]